MATDKNFKFDAHVNPKLYNMCKKINFTPAHVVEVGCYMPETSNVLGFISDGVKAELFEPDPVCIERIKQYFKEHPNVTLHPYAVYDHKGSIELYRKGSSTFVKGLKISPALVNDKYVENDKDVFVAQARTFNDFDDGSIDLLSVDTEGCEWYVLKYLVSRPMVISVETHGKKYVNPFIGQIQQWIAENKYKVWFKDKSDTVYIKNSFEIKKSFWENLLGS
jgi:FkbM family methyltransferase